MRTKASRNCPKALLVRYWLLACLAVTSAKASQAETYDWRTSDWGVCWSEDGCGPGTEERTVWCGDPLGRPVPQYLCRTAETPKQSRFCFQACRGIWKMGPWGECGMEGSSRRKKTEGLCLGVRHRNVTCYSVVQNIKSACPDPVPTSTVSCYTACPQDCVVGPWTAWTPCDRGCNTRKYRTRQVIVAPAFGGTPCPPLSESGKCPENCDAQKSPDSTPKGAPNVSAKLRVGEWGPCDSPLPHAPSNIEEYLDTKLELEIRDAERLRKRNTDDLDERQLDDMEIGSSLHPQVGFQKRNLSCIGSDGQHLPLRECLDSVQKAIDLSTRTCVLGVDCQLTEWTDWKRIVDGCVAPNGQVVKEVRERRRSALSLQKGPGTPCPHLLEQHTVSEPFLQPCTSQYQWLASSWGPCMSTVGPEPEARVTCGGGVQKRDITCVTANGHLPVADNFCVHVEPPPRYQRCEVGCERDCVVGPWSAWGICTPERCDTIPLPGMSGFRRRIREIEISASTGGKECPPLEEQEECLNAQCHQWLTGPWSECLLDDLSFPCGKGHVYRNVTCLDALGAPSENEECQLELGFVPEKEQCHVPCSFDCVIAPWSEWTPCSKACADQNSVGYTRRNTSILAHSGEGGRDCPPPDELTQVKTCREEPCSGAAWVPGEWGECLPESDLKCGPGIQIRSVFCVHRRNNHQLDNYACGGLALPKREKACDISCGTKCSMTPWSDWSACVAPKHCPEDNYVVTSKQTRWRKILIYPTEKNPPCGPTEEERPCVFKSDTCRKSKWRTTSFSGCALAHGTQCGTGFRVRAVECINGSGEPTYPNDCLLGTKIIPESSEECFVLCDRPCIVSTWNSWSSCPKNAPCDSSFSFRSRMLLAGTHLNPECQDITLMETRACPCLPYYSEPASDWSECLLGQPLPLVGKIKLGNEVEREGDETEREKESDETPVGGKDADEVCGVGARYRSLKCLREDQVLSDPSSCGHQGIESEPCMVECPADCLVGHWDEWSTCNATCGGGIQTRQRKVVQRRQWNGRKCPAIFQRRACWGSCQTRWLRHGWSPCRVSPGRECGVGEQRREVMCVRLLFSGMEILVEDPDCAGMDRPPERQECKLYCPGECVVSDWGPWTICPKTCEAHTSRSRARKILRIPAEGGMPCPPLVQTEPCILNISCWTFSWHASNWTDCVPLGRSSCGEGVRKRPVSCLRSDGALVSESFCSKEYRPLSQEKWCYVDCPIDCQVTPWADWDDSRCSCGEKPGFMKRKRYILVNPSESGRGCPTNLQEVLPCPVSPCYTWERSPWSECRLSGGKCGHGVMERRVRCVGPGGVDASADRCLALVHVGGHTWPYLAHALDLNTMDGCFVPCEGDCELTEWSAWSHCHRDCLRGQQGGTQTRSRAIISTGSSTPCPGPLWESRPCIAGPCLTFSWKIIHGSMACVRSDGLVVIGGCGDLPRPCVTDCFVPGSLCSPLGVCVCRPGLSPYYSDSRQKELKSCLPSLSASRPLALSQAKYLPEGINGWMFAMIGIGSSFVIFVIISVYLMSRNPREEMPIPLTVRRHTLHQDSSAQST